MNPKAIALSGWMLVLAAAPCAAGGTLATSELVPLMSQQPGVYAAVLASFELSESAFAWVRLGNDYPHLGGARLGPYEIEATVKATGKKIHVTLCTEIEYDDKAGRPVPRDAEESAFAVKEKLLTVLLQDTAFDRDPPCP